ncbi:MAG TPA: tetratricopeptide repeat protein [Opitutaceae bacterium]|nr:tetratricopeptide repeat protein [Opitutaceae bacterium]
MEIPLLPAMPPEVARAKFAVMQLKHPFMRMDNHISLVLQWRLFFPLLGYALSLPPLVYLALPPLGCWLVLVYIMAVLRRHEIGWPDCLAVAILTATCSWFFVSTGWLAYFDSWWVLGLLVFVFSRPRLAAIAVLITPWIDERFVITLPLAAMLRREYSATVSNEYRVGGRELGWLGILLAPWLLVRVGCFLFARDQATSDYIRDTVGQGGFAIKYYFLGLWQGIRCAWVFVGIWLGLCSQRSRWEKTGLVVIFLFTLIFNLIVAEDISRSVSILVPMILMGIILYKIHSPGRLRPVLFAACALNLLLPAAHVAGNGVTAIRHFYAVLQEGHPDEDLMAYYYNEMAVMYFQRNRPQDALQMVDLAIRRDPGRIEAHANRAAIYVALGQVREALSDADYIVARRPGSPDAWFDRGILRIKNDDLGGAAADFERAMRCAPPGWARQSVTQSILKQLHAKTSSEEQAPRPAGKNSGQEGNLSGSRP